MCAIIEDRIRINKIMSLTLSMRLDCRSTNLDELAHLCVVALQTFYDGACPEECLEARARDFAAWHLRAFARLRPRFCVSGTGPVIDRKLTYGNSVAIRAIAKTKNMSRYRKDSWLMSQSAANQSPGQIPC